MIEVLYHVGFDKDAAALMRRFVHFQEALEIFKRLCHDQFHPTQARQVIAPGKIHRVSQNDSFIVWKAELVVPKSGLRPNQYPRIWLAVKGAIVVFLAVQTHVDNYDDEETNRSALNRASDFF